MNKLRKIIISTFVLSFVAAGSFFVGKAFAEKKDYKGITVLAEDGTPTLGDGIVNHTLALSDTIHLAYYVHDSVAEASGDPISVYVWNSLEDAEKHNEPDYICDFYQDVTSESGTTYQLFLLKGLGYKNLVDVFYAAEVRTENGGNKIYSSIDDYSMLEYCAKHYDDTYKVETNSQLTLGGLVKSIVNYATDCQKYFAYRLDFLAANRIYAPRFIVCQATVGDQMYYFQSLEFVQSFINQLTNDMSVLNVVFSEITNVDELCLKSPSNIKEVRYIFLSGSKIRNITESFTYKECKFDIENAEVEKIDIDSYMNSKLVFKNCVITGDLNIVENSDYGANISFNGCVFKTSSFLLSSFHTIQFDNCVFGEQDLAGELEDRFSFEFIDCTSGRFNGCKFYNCEIEYHMIDNTNGSLNMLNPTKDACDAMLNINLSNCPNSYLKIQCVDWFVNPRLTGISKNESTNSDN